MNKIYTAIAWAAFILIGVHTQSVCAQEAFRKGSLLVSLSEGATYTHYSTVETNGGGNTEIIHKGLVDGDRDPLTIEYGISDRWGAGINLGGDILYLDPKTFYNFSVTGNTIKAIMSEFTLDVHYHFFVSKRTDVSCFAALGASSVSFKGTEGDHSYSYNAGGGIVRIGAQARYYVFRRFGLLAMLSTFSTSCDTKGAKGNTVGDGRSTNVNGHALEFGICYRFLK